MIWVLYELPILRNLTISTQTQVSLYSGRTYPPLCSVCLFVCVPGDPPRRAAPAGLLVDSTGLLAVRAAYY